MPATERPTSTVPRPRSAEPAAPRHPTAPEGAAAPAAPAGADGADGAAGAAASRARLARRRRLALALVGAVVVLALTAAAAVTAFLLSTAALDRLVPDRLAPDRLATGRALDDPVVPVAPAAEQWLPCRDGTSTAIDPAEAQLRLLPGELPDGWSTSGVVARQVEERGYCGSPALVALRTEDELVTGRFAVSGPFTDAPRVDGAGEPTPDTVAGRPAERYQPDGRAGGADDYDGVRHLVLAWTWQDSGDRHWLAETEGYSIVQAQNRLAGLHTKGERVMWDGDTGPELTVVHDRSGTAPGDGREYLEWYVELARKDEAGPGGSGAALIDVTHNPGTPAPLVATARLGARLAAVEGRQVVAYADEGRPGPDGSAGEQGAWVEVELAPGTVAAMATRADWRQAVLVLASLDDVPADDERLARLATDWVDAVEPR